MIKQKARKLFEMNFFDDIAPADISLQLGIPYETIITSIKQTKEKLKQVLDPSIDLKMITRKKSAAPKLKRVINSYAKIYDTVKKRNLAV
jgi:hypothetical protein